MAIREIRTIGDAILLKKSKEVREITPRIIELIEDTFDTMHEAGGIGIAAPQVGVLKRIAIIDAIPEAKEDSADVDDSDSTSNSDEESSDVLDTDDTEYTIDIEDEKLGGPLILINPVIINSEGAHKDEEGCLSVPGKRGAVTRPNKITVKAFNENMEEFELDCEGLLARAICHEIDHLNGVLYVDLAEDGLHDIEEDSEENPNE